MFSLDLLLYVAKETLVKLTIKVAGRDLTKDLVLKDMSKYERINLGHALMCNHLKTTSTGFRQMGKIYQKVLNEVHCGTMLGFSDIIQMVHNAATEEEMIKQYISKVLGVSIYVAELIYSTSGKSIEPNYLKRKAIFFKEIKERTLDLDDKNGVREKVASLLAVVKP